MKDWEGAADMVKGKNRKFTEKFQSWMGSSAERNSVIVTLALKVLFLHKFSV